jgi:hypothetical protein
MPHGASGDIYFCFVAFPIKARKFLVKTFCIKQIGCLELLCLIKEDDTICLNAVVALHL